MDFKKDDFGVQSQFSTDVLRLEIAGPNQEHLSVIDVPGLFQRHKEGVTTKADIDLVKRMVYGYMGNPRSVMLTVIPSNVDIATQGILEKAEELDRDGIRTLGVLTKPDLVDKGAEHNVVNLIKGREHSLRLGWHLLRNAGQAELINSIDARLQAETEFFNTVAPWKDLDKEKVGISSFRSRLQEVLSDHIRREFPKVRLVQLSKFPYCKADDVPGQIGGHQTTQGKQAGSCGPWCKTSNPCGAIPVFNRNINEISRDRGRCIGV